MRLVSSSSSESLPTSPDFEPLLFVHRITDVAGIEEAIKYRRLQPSRTSKSAVLGAFRVISQRTFLWTDSIDYINDATPIVRDSLN